MGGKRMLRHPRFLAVFSALLAVYWLTYSNRRPRTAQGLSNVTKGGEAPTYQVKVAVVTCEEMLNVTLLNIKAIVAFTTVPVELLLFADDENREHLLEEIASWPESVLERVRYNVSPVAFPEPNDKWKYLFKACASQRLFLPSMLPAVDALIYVDSDVMLLSPIEKLWQQFAAMNNSHLVALVPETESNYTNWYLYSAKHPFYKPLGVNSGVMLMNLTRMREFRWEERVLPLQEIYGDKIAWGDQDLINILFSLHPDRLLVLPCRWNYRTDHCMDGTYCDGEAPAVVHGSRNLFLHDNEPAFWALRQAMMQYKLGESLKDGFIAPLKDGLRRGRETPCMQQFLTHLVNWEAVALSVDNATAKSRHS